MELIKKGLDIMPKHMFILLMLVLGLSGCAIQESENIEKTVEDQYYEDVADQAKNDWEMEQDADNLDEYNKELNNQETNNLDHNPYDGCPVGCVTYIPSCDIKGNISFDVGEKIYHIAGGEFYSETTIEPTYGEKWFCTEKEAIANGWRKSSK